MAGIPALSGQRVAYTVVQLKSFRSGARSNDRNRIMRDVTRWLSDEEISAVSEYVAGLH
jgi:cytochrome c553